MKRILVTFGLVVIFCLEAHVGVAQPQFWNWYFGDFCAVNFSSGSPVAVAGGQTAVVEGTASISDAAGNLLFYTDGMTVWNRLNAIMPNGTGLHGNTSATESAIIVPKPGSTTLYYIFTADCMGGFGINYYTVDMTLSAGFGAVVSNVATNILLNAPEKVTAVRHCNGTDVWVLSHSMNTNTYYAWLVTSGGVGAPVLSNAGTNYTDALGYLKVSPNSRKLAACLFTQEIVEVLDFDNSNGAVSNTNVITIPLPAEYSYGCSFSPNSSILYEIGDASPAHLFQWDLSSNVQATVIASQYTVTLLPTSGGDIQIGPDGKVYVCHYSSAFLDVISNPNVLGVGCNYTANAVPLTGTCMIGLPNFIDAFNPQNVPVVPTDTTVCTSSVLLNAGAGATSYLWSNGATTDTTTVFVSGQYTCVVTGLNICNISVQHDTINVHIVPPIVVNLGNDTTVCAGAGYTLNAGNPGATYHWSTNDTTQTIHFTTSGTYSVTVTAGTCSDRDTITVTLLPAPVANLGNDTTICAGQPMTLDAGNVGCTYIWSTGATTQTLPVNTTANYSVTISNGTCSDNDTITVTFIPTLVVNLGPDLVVCSTQIVTLDAGNPGATYLWSTGATTQTISPVVSGTYSVTAIGGTCSDRDTVTVTFDPALIINLGPDVSLCNGVPLTLDAGNAGSTFVWSDGSTTQTISPTISGTYIVTVTNGPCVNSDTVNVQFNPLPIVNIGPDQHVCDAAPVTLDAGNAGAIYHWSNGATTQTITVNGSGTYSVIVLNGACSSSDTMILVEGVSPIVNLGPDIELCYGETVKLDAGNAGMLYSWNTASTTQSIIAKTTGKYIVRVNNDGCYGSDTINVKIWPQVNVSLGTDTFVCPGDQVYMDVGTGYSFYSWTPVGGNKHYAIVNQPGTYYCIVTDSHGCTGVTSKYIREFCPTNIYLPNSFSPNGNMVNDNFMAIGEGVIDFHMYIFDRWGETIFESNDIGQGWDGTYNGKDAPQGTYIYRVDYQLYDFLELVKHTKYGTVTLIR